MALPSELCMMADRAASSSRNRDHQVQKQMFAVLKLIVRQRPPHRQRGPCNRGRLDDVTPAATPRKGAPAPLRERRPSLLFMRDDASQHSGQRGLLRGSQDLGGEGPAPCMHALPGVRFLGLQNRPRQYLGGSVFIRSFPSVLH